MYGCNTAMPCLLASSIFMIVADAAQDAVRSSGKPGSLEMPWWMQQTALQLDGSIRSLVDQPWWERALALRQGESVVIPVSGEAKNRMLIRRESLRGSGAKPREAFIWIIDDDGDGSIRAGGDYDADCYVVDYGCDGSIDRMVDYIDNDDDGDMDELDIRYFDKGRLNWAWFGEDIDDDNIVRNVLDYERGDEFHGDPYGDNLFYMNKYNPEKGAWAAISECPFAFYDTDGDGFSETVVRVSVAPRGYDVNAHPDYANSAYHRPWERSMEDAAVVNIRYSFDVDRGSSRATPFHYDVGFNLVGSTPYRFAGMVHYNPKRRPPQETIVIPWKNVRAVADGWRAAETGFSWNENADDTVANGADPKDPNDYRWEGVFWMWERRFMPNTGGPCQKWNMRREWRGTPSDTRELYFSGVDRRVHLFGAEEGWIEIGYFSGLGAIGELRMYDTNGNGFFDRWEVYLGDDPRPVRVTSVRDERAKMIDSDPEKLTEFYMSKVLPGAIADRRRLMAAMDSWRVFAMPVELKRAMGTGSESYRRYAMDIACELQYQDFRSSLMHQAEDVLRKERKANYSRFMGDLLRIKNSTIKDPALSANSHTAWKLLRALAELDSAYGCGDTERACAAIDEIKRIGLFR